MNMQSGTWRSPGRERSDGRSGGEVEPPAAVRNVWQEPTQLLPLVDAVLMTPAARWRSGGGH